jgi:hypothetical protein
LIALIRNGKPQVEARDSNAADYYLMLRAQDEEAENKVTAEDAAFIVPRHVKYSKLQWLTIALLLSLRRTYFCRRKWLSKICGRESCTSCFRYSPNAGPKRDNWPIRV